MIVLRRLNTALELRRHLGHYEFVELLEVELVLRRVEIEKAISID